MPAPIKCHLSTVRNLHPAVGELLYTESEQHPDQTIDKPVLIERHCRVPDQRHEKEKPSPDHGVGSAYE